MIYKYYYIIIITLIFLTGCKNRNKIELESMIDEFNYLKNNNLLEDKKLQNLKSNFENLSFSSDYKIQVSSLYYLSKIAAIEQKIDEAYHFINQAYSINHSDSIYNQLNKLQKLLYPKIDTVKQSVKIDKVEIKNIFEIGRKEIKVLYQNQNYDGAISQTYVLIEMLKSLYESSKITIELSQLYQDLAIFHSQQNKLEEAKGFIEKAIQLNPNSENLEIQKLINKK